MSQSRTTPTSGTPAGLRQTTSSIHQGQPCQPCILCKKGNLSKYFQPKSWKDHSLLKRLQECEPTLIGPESCICRPCRNEIGNINIGDDNFTPRWRKSTIRVQQCYVIGCTNTTIKMTKIVDRGTIQAFFSGENENIEPMQVPTALEVEGTPLCTYHYGACTDI